MSKRAKGDEREVETRRGCFLCPSFLFCLILCQAVSTSKDPRGGEIRERSKGGATEREMKRKRDIASTRFGVVLRPFPSKQSERGVDLYP